MNVFYFRICAIVYFGAAVLAAMLIGRRGNLADRVIKLCAIIALAVKTGEYLFYAVRGEVKIPTEFSAQTYFLYSLVVLLDKRKKLYPLASFCGILAGLIYAVSAISFAERFVSNAEFPFLNAIGIIAHNSVLLGGLLILKTCKFEKNSFLQLLTGGSLFLVYALAVFYGAGVGKDVYLINALNCSLAETVFPSEIIKTAFFKPIYYAVMTGTFIAIMAATVLLNRILNRSGKRKKGQ